MSIILSEPHWAVTVSKAPDEGMRRSETHGVMLWTTHLTQERFNSRPEAIEYARQQSNLGHGITINEHPAKDGKLDDVSRDRLAEQEALGMLKQPPATCPK